MDRDRYVVNSFVEYDNRQLVDNGHLITALRASFISQIASMTCEWEANFTFDPNDPSIYTGGAGAAALYLKMFEENLGDELAISNDTLLKKADAIINKCLTHLKRHRFTFLCGRTGVLAIKCLICSHIGLDYKDYLREITKICIAANQTPDIPDEVLFGRAGVLYSLILLRSKLDESGEIIQDQLIKDLISSLLKSGQNTSRREKSKIPLVFYWHEKAYIGAAHGYAGILYILLEARQYLTQEQLNLLVKPTIDFVCGLQFRQSGNFPSSLSNPDDRLVHWCHGSPGVIHLLILAYQVFNDSRYLNCALKAADDIWARGLLKKGFGICHGVAGNGYAFLRLFQLTSDQKYLYRAVKFAEWSCGDGKLYVTRIAARPFSLFEGLAGTIFYLVDLLTPANAKFPAFQL